jgi:isopenicillin N synthase-like dioxygenase
MTQPSIPVIDMADYNSGDNERVQKFITTLGDALVDLGFFAVDNHGVDLDLVEKCYQLNNTFFQLSDDVKKKYEIENLKGQRGYTSYGKEIAKDASTPDLKEFWHVGRNLEKDHPLYNEYPENIWPEEVPEFKETFNELFSQLDRCSKAILEACALYLNLPKDRFSNIATFGNTILRLIHYPPVPESAHPSAIRAAAHEDINLITLLCESTASGLELLQRDGEWRQIHTLKGQIIGDAGDMLQNITNGYFKSTTHRVVNPDNSRERRFSMPFFIHPESSADLTPLNECIEVTGGEKKFPNITAGEYLQKRLKEIGLS